MNKDQEGLEVHYPQAGLEVVPGQNLKWPLQSPQSPDPVYTGTSREERPFYDPPQYSENDKEAVAQDSRPMRVKRKLWLAIGVTVLVVLAAVLGGVLGTTLHHDTTKPSSTPSPASAPTPTPTPSSTILLPKIRAKSSISVTGWLTGNQYSIRAVFQSDDDMVQYLAYESVSNAWKQTPNITKAKSKSPLALTSFHTSWYGTVTPQTQFSQVELFYLDSTNRLNEWSWNPTASTLGISGSLTPYTIPTNADSRLASYWPFIMYQEPGMGLHEVVYDCRFPGCWFNRTLNQTVFDGADITVVPAIQNLAALNIIYQRNDSKLMSIYRNDTTGILSSPFPFTLSVPETASFAALTTVRPSSDNTALNTYLLYQDSSGTIQVVWNDDASSWKGPRTFTAFNNADNGTDIACLTQASFFTDTPLQPNSPLSRCYFQANGALREVILNGSDWTLVGDVHFVP